MLLSAEIISTGSTIAEFITVLLIFVIVLAVAYFVTRYIGKFQKNQATGINIEVIDTARLSTTVCAEIVRVGGKYICVAVSKDNATYLCDVDEEEIIKRDDSFVEIDFGSILKKVKSASLNKNNTKSDQKDE